jgi:hypothetical protein
MIKSTKTILMGKKIFFFVLQKWCHCIPGRGMGFSWQNKHSVIYVGVDANHDQRDIGHYDVGGVRPKMP